jgi:hypothetical protein
MKPRVYWYAGIWVCQRGRSFTTWEQWIDAVADALRLIPTQLPPLRTGEKECRLSETSMSSMQFDALNSL